MPEFRWSPQPGELEFDAIRASGPGGQNVNKVSNAVHLRFDIRASSLPDGVKARLLGWADQRITSAGVVVIKAQESRSLALNRADAVARLIELVRAAAHVPKARRATKPTYGSQQRRLQGKARRSEVKAGRRRDAD
ncbi:alternative ribosome rescue aminoacyl-tRNA hydrolase ArfB [Pelomonas sp. UHG3]|uniref:Alternative ribosome rescue aminoacyl-tRNA hydrolase ArfB n=1 Tax=Roseateles hydrophilus TaxID=2975054 RepID=A0ACC6CA40_9BURK|nr:alternative ribosome rescue aminoacyl-tRNA hydrolase ArfB [Pelomonas sp. UHG3]MCY4745149.1 alternative ribosome rescue aminoacyl-tRNA hydrolase ArfB [Pelomonas sp. UHG3]